MLKQRGPQIFKKLVRLVILISFCLPLPSVLANEKGEAGNDGEIEFYLEKEVPKPIGKPKPKPNPKGKTLIKLPQTSNRTNWMASLIGGMLLVGTIVIVRERRGKHA